MHAEGLLDAQHQLDAREAVDAQIALELRIQRDPRGGAATQLGEQRADNVGQLLRRCHGSLSGAGAAGR